MDHVLLKDVHAGSQNWIVDARVVRFSDFMSSYEPNKRVRIELILLDAEGNAMEAQVPEYWHKRSKKKLEEDKIYTIRYFQVIKPKKSYRAVDRECMIEFGPYTTIEEPRSVPNNFPLYAHSAATFDALRAKIGDDIVTSDTIAILVGCSHVRDQHTQKSGTKRLRNLTITDGVETVAVALWGKHADAFDADACMQDSIQKPIVLLLCGMTCREFNGKLSLQNSAVCRWYINPDIPQAHALRQNFAGQIPPVMWLDTPNAAAEMETRTVSELAALRIPHLLENKRFLLTAKIKQIQPGHSWWYLACNKCNKTTRESGDTFKCSDYDCPCTEGTARYRLSLRVIDPNVMLEDNSAPEIQVVFFGPMAEEILGVSVHDLLNTGGGLGMSLPKQIEHLYGKIVTVRVGVGKFSFRNADNMCLQVNSIFSIAAKPKAIPNESAVAETQSAVDRPVTSEPVLKDQVQLENTSTNEIEEEHDRLQDPSNKESEEAQPSGKCALQTEESETTGERTPQVENLATPPPNLKRPCPSKGVNEPAKYRRGDSTARRKLRLEDPTEEK